MSYNQNRLTQDDIDFGSKIGDYTTDTISYLTNTKDVNDDKEIVITHRHFMEELKINHNYSSNQKAWNDSNKFIHTFDINKEIEKK